MSAVTLPEGDWIRGITIRQPWATCTLAGEIPKIRPVNWPWRGWIMIHTGPKLERPALRDPLVATANRDHELHLGAVVGVARLTGCHPDQGPEKCISPWAQRGAHPDPGRYRGGRHRHQPLGRVPREGMRLRS
ncbi:hypothetical protein [Streptomyces sp. NPDC006739]|uniref:hypothetical protein n=1 Tax=Streptomyces sp. NPDC006739 TaxID=3364763 RepID=UPI0036CCE87B